ncbi:MAG: hypothetical protein ILO10_06345 [Kiritimatiellae bacterium]|nr:hypothetical protein [Kiritimatiellia bacterium]
MATAIEQLLGVQDLDREIRKLRREVEAKDSLRAQIQAQVEPAKKRLAEAQARLDIIQAEIRDREAAAEDARLKIAKRKNDQLAIKSNEAYRAMEKEIAELHERVRREEDAAVEAMELREKNEKLLGLEKVALVQEETSVAESLARFDERAGTRTAELAALEARRAEAVKGIPGAILARYDRLFGRYGDAAIARVEHGTCGCCHMKLAPAQVVAAHKHDTVTSCDFCGRMLFAEQAEGEAPQEP